MVTDAFRQNPPANDAASAFPETRYTRFFRKVSANLAWITVALAAVGLLDALSAWLWPDRHAHPFGVPHQSFPALLAFALVGAALFPRGGAPSRWAQVICGGLILLIGFSCGMRGASVCHMVPSTTWIVLLLGFAVAAGASRAPMIGYVRQVAIFVVFFLCGLAVIGHLYRGTGEIPGIATTWTSALTAVLGAHALLFREPGFGVMRLLSGDGFGCHIMRRLLPSVIILLVTLGWLLAQGEYLGWYPATFAESLYAVLSITGFSAIMLFTAASLNRIDAERRAREDELRRSRSQMQAILDHASAYICLKDLSGRYLLVNKSFARLAGKSDPAECIGKTGPELFAGNYQDDIEQTYQSVLEGLAPVEAVNRFEGPGGVRYHLSARFPLLDADGSPYALCGIYTDITEIKLQEEEIQRLNASLREKTERQEAANRELEAFSYSVSHDLRAPLRHIAGFSQLLIQRSADALDEKSRHYLDVIQTSVRRMGALIDDLLSFSRANKVALAARNVPTAEMVREIRAELDAQNKGPAVEWVIGDLPDMRGDPAMLRQVWINLLSNAVKYSSKNPAPRIEVGHMPEGDPSGTWFVRDNGAGFDMRYADKLFGVFQRLHSDQEYEGTGIGLAMVRRILERHGGRIWAHGAPGEGATFYFVVPTAGAAAPGNPIPPAEGAAP